ncbi:preprotein translocase subunit SecE [Dyella thiooxydans]|nr:preprotein translocase subunit SecE [Dyella thiooxydans]
MNTKAEQSRGIGFGDIGKLVLAGLVLVAGIGAYSWYDGVGKVPQSVLLIGVLASIVASLAIAAFTEPGRRLKGFIAESQFELRKVVWPNRDETIKTTAVIIVVVIVLSLLLGLIDLILKSVVLDWLLKLGS